APQKSPRPESPIIGSVKAIPRARGNPMRKRTAIRGLLLIASLLCVMSWIISGYYSAYLGYEGSPKAAVANIEGGKLFLRIGDPTPHALPEGWYRGIQDRQGHGAPTWYPDYPRLGFQCSVWYRTLWVAIPFWFPTITILFALLLACRPTKRPTRNS